MNKAKVIGLAVTGLAVVGGLAIFSYYRKPKASRGKFLSMDGENFYDVEQSDFSNMDGENFYDVEDSDFSNVDGRVKATVSANCGRRNTDGSYSYYYAQDGQCKSGFKRVANFGDRNI